MNRKEAEALIGSCVRVWTAANGEYVGTLESVFRSPWRGTVRISGIIAPAQHYERGSVCRRGFRVGETIEAGGSSIRPTESEGCASYLDILEQTITEYEQRAESYPQTRNSWVWPAFIKALKQAAIAEKRRLETGQWKLSAD